MREDERIKELINRLSRSYPDAKCSLDYRNPYELLVATILSAQCTDKRVNEVSPALFKAFPGPEEMARAPIEEIEALIRSAGFFRQKAKGIQEASRILMAEFSGEVPSNMEDLVKLPSVGRKTANVVLGNAFSKAAGVVVDTHVRRLSQRLGLTKLQDPEKIEKDLNKKIPQQYWVEFPHWLIHHGRQICTARNPKCLQCPLLSICPRKGLPPLKLPAASLEMDSQGEIKVKKKKLRPRARAIGGKKR